MLRVSKTMRNELKMYWGLCLEKNAAIRNCVAYDLSEIRDEFETLAMMTDWPLLKSRCHASMAKIDNLPLAASA